MRTQLIEWYHMAHMIWVIWYDLYRVCHNSNFESITQRQTFQLGIRTVDQMFQQLLSSLRIYKRVIQKIFINLTNKYDSYILTLAGKGNSLQVAVESHQLNLLHFVWYRSWVIQILFEKVHFPTSVCSATRDMLDCLVTGPKMQSGNRSQHFSSLNYFCLFYCVNRKY